MGSRDVIFWVKDKQSPAHELPENASSQLYVELRANALEQRSQAPTGVCPPDMAVLYQFWSHFLVRNFNKRMYEQFRQLAENDVKDRSSNVGWDHLIKYYQSAVLGEIPIRSIVAKDLMSFIETESEGDNSSMSKDLLSLWKSEDLNEQTRESLRSLAPSGLLDA
jgi:la-related protein 1